MTKISKEFAVGIDDDFRELFLKKLRHDLTNAARPMVEIPAWIEEDIVEEGYDVPASLRENLDMLSVYGTRLFQMLRDLLTYAHVPTNPNGEKSSVGDALQALAPDLHSDFRLLTDIAHDNLPISAPELKILLDALMTNAVKHHDGHGGKIMISSRNRDGVEQLSVADDGPGIDPQFLEKVFDPLTTLQGRDAVEGSGMGLTIARRIVELNGGSIKAISKRGCRGTCIVVWFN